MPEEKFICFSPMDNGGAIEARLTGDRATILIADFRTKQKLTYQFMNAGDLEQFCIEVLDMLGVEVPNPAGVPRVLSRHLDRFVKEEA